MQKEALLTKFTLAALKTSKFAIHLYIYLIKDLKIARIKRKVLF